MSVADADPAAGDTEALLQELRGAFSGQYDKFQRYQDFRAVFLGSEQGKRVLWQLLAWGHMYKTSIPLGSGPIDALRLAANEGERNIALQTLTTIQVEPRNVPQRANSKPKGDA